ncbi:MAG TPA: hypothetical protein PK794_10920, partial [Armatimonadota bacterium]|nr:hypothetical protein [Armatimonadota bacterium]
MLRLPGPSIPVIIAIMVLELIVIVAVAAVQRRRGRDIGGILSTGAILEVMTAVVLLVLNR